MAAAPLRVLMLGPALEAPGGVAVVARRLLEAPPAGVALEYVATTTGGGRGEKARAGLRAAIDLVGCVRRFRPELAHVHVGGGLSLARKAALVLELRALGVPVVSHCHFAGVQATARPGPQRALLRSIAAASAGIVVLSRAQEELLRPLAGDRVRRVQNGVPTDRFTPLGPPYGPPTLLYLGGGEERKGWRELRSALDLLPDRPWRARLAGPGGEVLRAAFAGIEQVEVLGRLDERGTIAALQDAHLFVLPSRAEGLPLALLEAMSCGLACVATEVDGMVDALDHGRTGLLVPTGDPPALAAAIATLLADPAQRHRLGRAARATAIARHDLQAMGAQLLDLWRGAAGHPAASA